MHDCMFARYTVRQFLDLQSILSNLGEKTTRGSLTHIPKLFAPHHVCTYHWQQKTQMATAIVSFWSLSLIVLHFFFEWQVFSHHSFCKKKIATQIQQEWPISNSQICIIYHTQIKVTIQFILIFILPKKNLESILGTKKKVENGFPFLFPTELCTAFFCI